ncbi:hypothetical protein SDC9_85282 [bioreactor metagenome]|uniref:Uncharacterized protein n=1 Tax=bioreactor metagenome TaxID=1076179 RepID=A0A644ZCM9_9ZZZZ
MRPYLFAVFDVPVHTQYFERKELLRYRRYLLDTGLFLRFPDGCRQKIGFAIHVTTHPSPRLVDVMVNHQHLGTIAIDDPTRSGEVG